MFQKRSLTSFLVASLGLAAGLAVMSSPNLASADDCGDLKKAAVQKICKDKGGKKGVDNAMKDAVKAAKKAGKTIECKDCHDTGDNNKLKGNADKDFDAKLAEYFPK